MVLKTVDEPVARFSPHVGVVAVASVGHAGAPLAPTSTAGGKPRPRHSLDRARQQRLDYYHSGTITPTGERHDLR